MFTFVLMFLACQPTKPRKPIHQNKNRQGNHANYSVALNKALVQHQELQIQKYIQQDSLNQYTTSNFGFFYTILKHGNPSGSKIQKGTEVVYEKTLFHLNGKQIYSPEQKKIVLGKSDEIKGIVEGLKLMKEGDQFKFIFTSFAGYGMYGDEKKIKGNTPIITIINILNINNK